jgi:hypothetical protein
MPYIFRLVALMLLVLLAACSGPKPPPGWPTGEERPINGSPVTPTVPKAVK